MEQTTYDKAACQDICPLCRGKLNDKRLKRYCTRCGTLCETCCDGGEIEAK